MNDASRANRACPYFGLLDDADTSLAFPSIWSGCHRSHPVAPPNLRHQAEYCLGENHLQCTVFLSQQEAAPLPAHLRSSHSHAHEPKRSPIRIFAFIFIGIVILAGLGWFFLTRNLISLPAATPTPSAPPQPTAAEPASPTTVRASKTPIATGAMIASPPPGSVTVTFTMTATASFTSTHTATSTSTLSITLTASPAATYTATHTATPTRTPTRTPTKTPTPTHTATRTATPTPTWTSTKPPTSTHTATLVQTATPTVSLSKRGLDMPIGSDYKFVIHRVLDGENLNQFADKYNTSVEAILAVNYNLQPPVWVDSLVIIPVKFSEVASLPAFEAYQATQAGKSLDALAQELGVSAADLKYYNAIGDAESLLAGDWLLIPRSKKPAP